MKNIIILLLFFCSLSFSALAKTKLKVCDDINEFPPYTFVLNKKITGYSVEALTKILNPKDYELHIDLLPWSRCLKLVEDGVYDLALNATLNSERKEKFLSTRTFFKVREVHIYRRGLFKEKIKSLDSFKHLIPCGLRGYNYSSVGIDDNKVVRADSIESVMTLIKHKRCDYFNIDYEVLLGFKVKKNIDFIADTNFEIYHFNRNVDYYLLLSKKTDKGSSLLKIINDRLDNFLLSSENQELLKRYNLNR